MLYKIQTQAEPEGEEGVSQGESRITIPGTRKNSKARINMAEHGMSTESQLVSIGTGERRQWSLAEEVGQN